MSKAHISATPDGEFIAVEYAHYEEQECANMRLTHLEALQLALSLLTALEEAQKRATPVSKNGG